MEEGAVLVKEAEKKIPMKIEEGKLYIGDMPQLIVDLDTQENYIRTEERLISYKKRILKLRSSNFFSVFINRITRQIYIIIPKDAGAAFI